MLLWQKVWVESRDELYEELKDNGIHSRRYFYPLIPDFPMYRDVPSADPANLPVARDVVRRIPCLPIYPDLELAQVEKICGQVARLVRPLVQA